jgi:hypothetical protein
MSTADTLLSLVAYIRRLSAAGPVLYIRIGNSDISRLGLSHGQGIEINLGRVRITGIVKTSGGSPWLAPAPGVSNAAITAALRGARFEHGMDVQATARLLNGGSESIMAVNIAPARAVTRTSVPSRDDWRSNGVAPQSISMSDPLAGFGWTTLLARYDAAAFRGYDTKSEHLRGWRLTTNDRDLYYQLVTKAATETRPQLGADWYEALLYWKLYSQPAAVSNITAWLKGFAPERLRQFLAKIPKTIPRKVSDVVELVELAGKYQFPGMKSSTALPVRTTFLHILYPDVIPIFDKMVLKAVGAWRKGANQDTNVLRQYIPHAWALADKHTQQLSGFKESPVRLVDMALWFMRSSA